MLFIVWLTVFSKEDMLGMPK